MCTSDLAGHVAHPRRQQRHALRAVFVDADKPNNPHYLDWALRLGRPDTLIVADNIVQDGRVADPDTEDDRGIGVRRFVDLLATNPKVDATGIQIVDSKGWDGFALALVSG